MEGVSIVETKTLQSLILEIQNLRTTLMSTIAELKDTKKPYMTTAEVVEFTGFGSKWVWDNKDKIGFTMIGNHCRFKRSDVVEFMEQNYFKSKKR